MFWKWQRCFKRAHLQFDLPWTSDRHINFRVCILTILSSFDAFQMPMKLTYAPKSHQLTPATNQNKRLMNRYVAPLHVLKSISFSSIVYLLSDCVTQKIYGCVYQIDIKEKSFVAWIRIKQINTELSRYFEPILAYDENYVSSPHKLVHCTLMAL